MIQISQLCCCMGFKITCVWTFMNFKAERLIQTSFLSKEQCLFWTSRFGRTCFVWTFSFCRSPPGHHTSSRETPTTFGVSSSNNSVCRSCVRSFACRSLYFLSVRWWQLFLHSPIASTKSVLPARAIFAQEPFNILEPLIKANCSTELFSCNELAVSNAVWEGSCFHICWIPCQYKVVGLARTDVFLSVCPEGVGWIDSVPN